MAHDPLCACARCLDERKRLTRRKLVRGKARAETRHFAEVLARRLLAKTTELQQQRLLQWHHHHWSQE